MIANVPADLDLWDFAPISLFGIDQFLEEGSSPIIVDVDLISGLCFT